MSLAASRRAKDWTTRNYERHRENVRRWQSENADKVRLSKKSSRARLKAEVIAGYGGECECCKERSLEFLTMDHKLGGGTKLRRAGLSTTKLYHDLKKAGFPKDDYRVLCFNCNAAIGLFGYCPHSRYQG